MSTNYSEQIFQSIDTIISQRLNEVSFDKTEICEIISIDEKTIGKYLVSNGSLKYEAYSDDENRKYQIGSKVYVRITNGDYTLRKIITGSYTADEMPKNLYTNPFDHFIISSKHSFSKTKGYVVQASAERATNVVINNQGDKGTGNPDSDINVLNGLTFYYSGLGQFNYIGLDFSATTGFGGTAGEFRLILTLKDNANNNLAVIPFSSKQLYGNPYYLTNALYFQHLFPLPFGNFSDLTKITSIELQLETKGDFNYKGDTQKVTINDVTLYFGFDSTQDSMSNSSVALVLDEPISKEYETSDDIKKMSIDWRNIDTNAIYNETTEMQYPEAGLYNIYWLQYSESIGYTKKLEPDGLDIEESGTYWKTVKRQDAAVADAYAYTLSPSPDWKKEQIKVIIKNIKTNDYIESNGLTFNNTNFRTETGSNKGKPDTLKLMLAEGDDGIYNSYGIDNKLLGTYDLAHSLTVNYVDNTKWDWNPEIQKVIWKIPAKATMIRQPGEGWRLEDNFYVYDSNPNLQTIKFNLSYQFSYNKTNNTIYCNIIRYKDKNRDIITDEYQGSITLQFGLQNTAGTGWAFNIIQNQRALSYPSDTMTLTATFENENGEPISLDSWKDKVKWEWYQSSNNSYRLKPKSDNKHQAIIERSGGGYDPYAIVKATLVAWQNSNGKNVDLEAYLPIAAGHPSYYLTGASRVVYNNTGNAPIYDEEAYGLYNQETHNLVSPDYTYTIMSPETNPNKVFAINEEEGNLKPLNLLPTQVPKMSLVVKEPSGTIVYAQPILVLKNGYQSKLLNEWDGNLKVDTENNSIFSALMGAGIKNDDNTFTGVLMGAVGKTLSTARTGIYGVESGELRYKLDEKGDFYVGTGSDNKIDFSGTANSGKTLTIAAKNFKLTTNKLTIDSNNGIKLLDNDGNIIIQILNNGTATISGWSIDKQYIQSSDEVVGMSATNANYAFWAGFKNWNGTTYAKFKVTQNGKLYAEGVDIQGKLTINNESLLNGTKVSDINSTTITSTPNAIALKAFEQETTINGVTKTLNAHLKLNADNINAKVSKVNDGITEIMSWNLTSGSFTVKANGTQVMKVTKDGLTIKGNGTFSGDISAATGTFKGSINVNRQKFYVDSSGNVTISGKLTVNGTGSIAGWTISSTGISKGNTVLNGSTGNITMGSGTLLNGVKFGTSGYSSIYTDSLGTVWTHGDKMNKLVNSYILLDKQNITLESACDTISTDPASITLNKDVLTLSGKDIIVNGIYAKFHNIYLEYRWDSKSSSYKNWVSFGRRPTADPSPPRIKGQGKNLYLHAESGGAIYAGGEDSNDKITTQGGSPSTLNLKTSLVNIKTDYNNLYQELQQINMYNYDYQYDNLNNENIAKYGFIIDEIENTQYLSQYFKHYDKYGKIIDNNLIVATQNDYDIQYKIWDRDSYIKGQFILIKTLQNKIDQLEKEIKEIKQNEI